jgi:hypothetical protein
MLVPYSSDWEWNRNIFKLFQKYFGIIKLNPENYYVDQAPVYLVYRIIK